jgi:hypothetical protein
VGVAARHTRRFRPVSDSCVGVSHIHKNDLHSVTSYQPTGVRLVVCRRMKTLWETPRPSVAQLVLFLSLPLSFSVFLRLFIILGFLMVLRCIWIVFSSIGSHSSLHCHVHSLFPLRLRRLTLCLALYLTLCLTVAALVYDYPLGVRLHRSLSARKQKQERVLVVQFRYHSLKISKGGERGQNKIKWDLGVPDRSDVTSRASAASKTVAAEPR